MTTPGSRGTEYDHTRIRDVARQMRRELASYSGPGTLPDLTSRGKVPAAAFGTWDTAQVMGKTVEQGNIQIVRAYQQFLDGFLSVANALEKVADNYRDADEKTLAGIRSVGRRAGGPAPSGTAPTRSTVQPME
ncbi:hypothetical protein [Actinomadura sediminis]|uniref:PE domain-containing protein n=1 Tax=Actinomadura sediminis TaxID=1038904 RepID=A0ABW3EMI0_9ACTN